MVTRSITLSRWLRARGGPLVFGCVWLLAAGVCATVLLSLSDGVGSASLKTTGFRASSGTVTGEMGRLAGTWKFSDVVQIPGTDQMLLVDDDTSDRLFRWRVTGAGDAEAEITPVALPAGVKLEDGEGITTDGQSIFVIGSHSLTQDGRPRENVLLKLRWTGSGVELEAAIPDLQTRLESAFPALARVRGRTPDQGGLNIEGLAWDPRNKRLLLGLRGPLFEGRPVVVPFRLTARPGGEVDVVWDGQPIPIPGIVGVGIRGIQFDPEVDAFVVITGGVGRHAAGSVDANRFALWRWSGAPDQPAEGLADFPESTAGIEMKPEGVSRVQLPDGSSYLLVVADDAPFYWRLRTRADQGTQPLARTGGQSS